MTPGESPVIPGDAPVSPGARSAIAGDSPGGSRLAEADLRAWLIRRIAEVCDVAAANVAAGRPFAEYGLGSRDSVQLCAELSELTGREVPVTLLWQAPTVDQLARQLSGVDAGAGQDAQRTARPDVSAPGGGPGGPGAAPVAVIGLGCRFPGATGPDAFWSVLADGRATTSTVPDARWTPFADGSARTAAVLAGTTRHGGFLDDVAGFDAEHFAITPAEAESMDPQQRLIMEVAWEALEHAALAPRTLRGSATGVFVGVSGNEYSHLTTAEPARVDGWTSSGGALSMTANRLSYALDLRGPSLAVDTACSSSLVAVHHACQSLRTGESTTALAGGVNLLLSPAVTVAFDRAGALAPDGRCKAFAAAADGIVRGEGCGVVVLKLLADAQRDGDRVLAVIRGSAINSDGRSNGLFAPNPVAQTALLRTAYEAAGVPAHEVDYVEAHGTGTLLGDPIEAQALGEVLGAGRPAERPLLIGSVKSNIGHTEAAAGVAGLIKVVLSLGHRQICASLHVAAPNPHIPFARAGLRVAAAARPWPAADRPRRAGVSAFGFGGSNAHVVVEEAATEPVQPSTRPAADPSAEPATRPYVLSADSSRRLADAARILAEWVASPAGQAAPVADIARTLARRYDRGGRRRAAIVARDRAGLRAGLLDLAAGRVGKGVVLADAADPTRDGQSCDPVWVFSGYGTQWAGMARRLLADEPVFAAAIAAVDPLLAVQTGRSLLAELRRDEPTVDVAGVQPMIFGIQVALARLWRAYGVRPAAVIGHSMGEVAAAVAAGALNLDDAVRVIGARSRLLSTVHGGAMAVVELSAVEVEELARWYPGVAVAVHASATRSTITGPDPAVRGVVEYAEAHRRGARLLDVPGAGHSSDVEPILGELTAELAGVRPYPPEVPFFSTVLDDSGEPPVLDAAYWVANVRRPVRFRQAVQAAAAAGHTRYLEVSPHAVLGAALSETLSAVGVSAPLVLGTLRRDTDDTVAFHAARAHLELHAGRVPTDHGAKVGDGLVDLPTTGWRHRPFWTQATRGGRADDHALLGTHVEVPDEGMHLWSGDVGTRAQPWLAERPVHGVPVLTAAAALELMLAGAARALDVDRTMVQVTDLSMARLMPLAERCPITTELRLTGSRGRVSVRARDGGGTWRVYATGSVGLVADDLAGDGRHTDAADARRPAGAGRAVTADARPAAEAHDDVTEPTDVVLADASATDPAPGTHLAALDACLRVLAAGVPAPDAAVLLPLAIGRARVRGEATAGRCRVTMVADPSTSAPPRGDIVLIHAGGDGDGQIVAELSGVRLAPVARADIPVPVEELLFEAAWRPTPLPPAATDPTGGWLVVVPPTAVDPAAPLADPADAAGVLELSAVLGDGGAPVYVTAWAEADIRDALTALRHRTGQPPAGVLLLADPPGAEAPDFGEPEGEADRQAGDRGEAGAVVLGALAAVRAIVDSDAGRQSPRLWLLTRGATDAFGGPGRPDAACLRGLVRVLAFEHPELRATLLDLHDDDGGPGGALDRWARLRSELRADSEHDEVAWHGGERLTRALARTALQPRGRTPGGRRAGPPVGGVRPGAAYAITGGLGGLGLVVAGWLAQRGAGRIVLCGRRALDDAARRAVDGLRETGATVEVVRGDIAAAGVAERVVAAATAHGNPLAGVVHAAADLVDGVATGVDAATLRRVWAPKAAGAWRLHEATVRHNLDWLVLFSSAAALLGSPGQAAYATANAWLDGFAVWRRQRGLPATSINWGVWSGAGGAGNAYRGVLDPLTPGQGVEALEAVLAADNPVVGVIRLDPVRVAAGFPDAAGLPFLAPVLRQARAAQADDDPVGQWPGPAALAQLPPAQARHLLYQRLRSRTAAVLGVDPERVDGAVRLTDLGLDSLSAVRVASLVQHDTGVAPSRGALVRGASLAEIADELAAALELPAVDERQPGAEAPVAGAADTTGGGRTGVFVQPRDAAERLVANVWQRVFDSAAVSALDDFAAMGGHTEDLPRVAAELTERLGHRVRLDDLRVTQTVQDLGERIRSHVEAAPGTVVRPLRVHGTRPPVFFFHPAGGPTSVYRNLVGLLGDDQPCYGLERLPDCAEVTDKAARYVQLIRQVRDTGPYRLAGWSFGGYLAYEVARQFAEAGETVESVGLIDALLPLPTDETADQRLARRMVAFNDYVARTYGRPLDLPYAELAALTGHEAEQIDLIIDAMAAVDVGLSPAILRHQRESLTDLCCLERYDPPPYGGPVVLYRTSEETPFNVQEPRFLRTDAAGGWEPLCPGITVVPVSGHHLNVLDPPHVEAIAAHLAQHLQVGAPS